MNSRKDPTTGELLLTARRDACMSQTELARRANVTQSVVSAYESDQRDPSLKTLSRLVEATGHHLNIQVNRTDSFRAGLPDTRLGRRLRQNRKEILAYVTLSRATNVRVFGSVARGEDTSDSDVDLLVDVEPGVGLFTVGQLEYQLSEILGCNVDLATSESLRPAVRLEAERDAVAL